MLAGNEKKKNTEQILGLRLVRISSNRSLSHVTMSCHKKNDGRFKSIKRNILFKI